IIGDSDGEQVFIYRGVDLPVEEELTLAPLDGTFWYLVSISDQPLVPGSEITAQFMVDESGLNGVIGGSSGCNGYNAGISVESGAFEVSLGVSTQIFCEFPPGLMEQEQAYLAALKTVSGYSRAGDQLLMPSDSGVLTYSSTQPESTLDQTAELQNITWYLVSYNTLTPVAGAEPTAFFDTSNTVSGNTGCNDYTGAYKTEPGNSLTISDIATTRAACTSDALTKQEQDFTILMQSAINYLVAGDQLNILTVDGGVMNFTSVPPAGPTGPTAVISAPSAATVGETVTFDGTGSQAGSSPIVDYQWQFGDGAQGSGPTVQYAYGNPGNYTVSLTVIDQLGLSNTTSQAIAVSAAADQPPTAAITGPTAVAVNESATYSAAGSTQGSAAITRYIWNFGDGTALETTEPTATTVFRVAGVFNVTVTVVDANNLSDSAGMQTSVGATLQGTEWVLNNTLPGTSITIQFANDTLSGFGGCNSYNSTYTASANGAMTIGLINSSQALCSEEINQQEQAYFASLSVTSAWSISGSQLTLTTANGPPVFTGRPLATPYQ
ncbi:MAG: META domain-containing protein, partial [Chloroflexota bacterium]